MSRHAAPDDPLEAPVDDDGFTTISDFEATPEAPYWPPTDETVAALAMTDLRNASRNPAHRLTTEPGRRQPWGRRKPRTPTTWIRTAAIALAFTLAITAGSVLLGLAWATRHTAPLLAGAYAAVGLGFDMHALLIVAPHPCPCMDRHG